MLACTQVVGIAIVIMPQPQPRLIESCDRERNLKSDEPVKRFFTRLLGAYHVDLPQTIHPNARWHAKYALENAQWLLDTDSDHAMNLALDSHPRASTEDQKGPPSTP